MTSNNPESFFHDDEHRENTAKRSLEIRQQLDLARAITPSHDPASKAVIDELFEQFYADAIERNDAITLESWGIATEEGKSVHETQSRMMKTVESLVDTTLTRWSPDERKRYAPHSSLFVHMMRIMQLLEQQATANFDINYAGSHGGYSESALHHIFNRVINKAKKQDRDPRADILKRIEGDFNLDDIETGILETRLAAEDRVPKNS